MSYKAVKWWSRRQTGGGARMSGLDELKRGFIAAERQYNQGLEELVTLLSKVVSQSSYRGRTIATTAQRVKDCSDRLLVELESYLINKLPLEGIYNTLSTHLEHFYVYCTYSSQLEELRAILRSAGSRNEDATDPTFSAEYGLERSLLPIYRLHEMRAQLQAMLPVLTACNYRVELFHCRSTIDQITQILDQCFKVLSDVNVINYAKTLGRTLKDSHKKRLEDSKKNEGMHPNIEDDNDPLKHPGQSEHDCDETEGNDKTKQSEDKTSFTSRNSKRQSRSRSLKKGEVKTLQRLSTESSKPNRIKTKFKANGNGAFNSVPRNHYSNVSVFPLQLHKPYEESIFTVAKNSCRPRTSFSRDEIHISESTGTRTVSRLGRDFNARTRETITPPPLRACTVHESAELSSSGGDRTLTKHPTVESNRIYGTTEVGGASNGIKTDGISARRKIGPAVPKKRNTNLNRGEISPACVENIKESVASNRIHEEVGLFEKPVQLKKAKPVPPSKPRRKTAMPDFLTNHNGKESSGKSEQSSEKVESTSDVVKLRENFRNRSMTTNQHLQDEYSRMDSRRTRYGVIVGRNQDWRDTCDVRKLETNHKSATTDSNRGSSKSSSLQSGTQRTCEVSISVKRTVPKHDHSKHEQLSTNTADSLDEVDVRLDEGTLQPVDQKLQPSLEESSPEKTADNISETHLTKNTEGVVQPAASSELNQFLLPPEKPRVNAKYLTKIIRAMKPQVKNRVTSHSPFKSSTEGNNLAIYSGVLGGEPTKSTTHTALGESSGIQLDSQQQSGSKEVKYTTSVSDDVKCERLRAETGSENLKECLPLPVKKREARKNADVPSEMDRDIQLCLNRLEKAVLLSSTMCKTSALSENVPLNPEETHRTDTLVDKSTKLPLSSVFPTGEDSNVGNVFERDWEHTCHSTLEDTNTQTPEMSSAIECTEYFNSIMSGTSQNVAICKSPIDIEEATGIGSRVVSENVTSKKTSEDKLTRISDIYEIMYDADMEKSHYDLLNEITITVQKANGTDEEAMNVDNVHQTTGFNDYENYRRETQSRKESFATNFLKLRSSFDEEENTSQHSSSTERTVSTTTSSLFSEYELPTPEENIYDDVQPSEENQPNGITTSTSQEDHQEASCSRSSTAMFSCFARKRSVIKHGRTKRLVRDSWKTAPLYQNYFARRCHDDDRCRHTYQNTETPEVSRCEGVTVQRPATTIPDLKLLLLKSCPQVLDNQSEDRKPKGKQEKTDLLQQLKDIPSLKDLLLKPCPQKLDSHSTDRKPEEEKDEPELQQQQDYDDEHPYVDMSLGKASFSSSASLEKDPIDHVTYEVMLKQNDSDALHSSHDVDDANDDDHIYECVEDILAVCNEEDKAMKTRMKDADEERGSSFVLTNKQPRRLGWCDLAEVIESGVLGKLSNREKALYESKYELITSKVSYLKSLTILQTVFVENELMRTVLTNETRDLLFGFVTPIKRCSEHFLADLLSGWPRDLYLNDMVTVIEHYASSALEVYVEFCAKQVRIYEMLKALKQSNKAFRKVLTSIESDEILEGHCLESFLILPVQRITRFPLLVGSILCHLDREHEEYSRWNIVHQRLLQVTVECNEAVRLAEKESHGHGQEIKPAKSPRGKGTEKRSLWFTRRKASKSP